LQASRDLQAGFGLPAGRAGFEFWAQTAVVSWASFSALSLGWFASDFIKLLLQKTVVVLPLFS